MKRYIIIVYILLTIISSGRGQNVNVTSSFDTSGIYIGDQIRFIVTVDQPAGLRLSLPSFRDTLIRNIEILQGPVVDSSANKDGRLKVIMLYLVTSFDSGRYQVPPVYAELKNENGLKRFYSDYALLEVMRVNIAPQDTVSKIFDIIKPYRAPLTVGEILPWVLLAVIVAVAAWFAIRYIQKLKKAGKDVRTIVNPDPAHVIAFREFEKLREEKLWQKGEIKIYYTRLTGILRQYLENRFMVYSLELTTSETLEELLKTGFKKDGAFVLLEKVLTVADLVKFAKYTPEPSEHEYLYQDSWNFVFSTKAEVVINRQDDINNKETEGSL